MQTMSASRVGWQLHQRVDEHKRSTIGNHVKDEHEKGSGDHWKQLQDSKIMSK